MGLFSLSDKYGPNEVSEPSFWAGLRLFADKKAAEVVTGKGKDKGKDSKGGKGKK